VCAGDLFISLPQILAFGSNLDNAMTQIIDDCNQDLLQSGLNNSFLAKKRSSEKYFWQHIYFCPCKNTAKLAEMQKITLFKNFEFDMLLLFKTNAMF
jgi:hypothetical protein